MFSHQFLNSILILLCVSFMAFAQPDEPNFAQIEKELTANLEKIEANPQTSVFYEKRGEIYAKLYSEKHRFTGLHNVNYAQNVIADFAKALKLVDKSYPITERNSVKARIYSARGNHYRNLYQFQRYQTPKLSPAQTIDYIYNNRNFKNAVADFLKATKLDSTRKKDFSSLRTMYSFRAQTFLHSAELKNEIIRQKKTDRIWKDFDKELKYVELAREKGNSKVATSDAIYKKGKTAFAFERYDISLQTFQLDEKYFGKDYAIYCGEGSTERQCTYEKRMVKSWFSFWRAKIYLKLNEPLRALGELEIHFSETYLKECPSALLLRAETYTKLGKIDLAVADENKAQEVAEKYKGRCSY